MKHNPVILIVEDDQFNYDLLEVILSGLNARILWARSAEDAMHIFNSDRPDLILMDIKLPGKDGYTLTKEFKGLNKDIPIIAQTAYALNGDREKAMEAGCDDYITKPIRKGKLMEIIENLMHMQGRD
jgi:two-component system, cell cycle response regulator DivK